VPGLIAHVDLVNLVGSTSERVSCLHTGTGKEVIYESFDIDGGSICVCNRRSSGADTEPISQQDRR
jgi:hypothetical protein